MIKKLLALLLLIICFFCASCTQSQNYSSDLSGEDSSYIQSDSDLDNSTSNPNDESPDILEIKLEIDQADNIEIEVNELLYLTVTTMN